MYPKSTQWLSLLVPHFKISLYPPGLELPVLLRFYAAISTAYCDFSEIVRISSTYHAQRNQI